MNCYYPQNAVYIVASGIFSLLLGHLVCCLCTKRDQVFSLLPQLSGSLFSVGAVVVLGCCKSELNETEVL